MAQRRREKSTGRKTREAALVRKAAEFGIDISALRDNLKRSYDERIRRHQIALNTVEKLRKAKSL
jgi:hypothetical protein